MNERERELLELAGERATQREFYLASSLRLYQSLRNIDDVALARHLGCDIETLDEVRLCRRPDVESADFRSDVQAIAQRFGVGALPLAKLLRELSASEAMRSAPAEKSSAVLLAARDRRRRRSRGRR